MISTRSSLLEKLNSIRGASTIHVSFYKGFDGEDHLLAEFEAFKNGITSVVHEPIENLIKTDYARSWRWEIYSNVDVFSDPLEPMYKNINSDKQLYANTANEFCGRIKSLMPYYFKSAAVTSNEYGSYFATIEVYVPKFEIAQRVTINGREARVLDVNSDGLYTIRDLGAGETIYVMEKLLRAER